MTLPWFLRDLKKALRCYETSPAYCVHDLETTSLDKGSALNEKNRIILESKKSNWFEFDEIYVAHNAKFELQWMIREGKWDERLLVWDTMIAQYVINGGQSLPLDLDSVAKSYGLSGKGRLIHSLMGEVPTENMPSHILQAYCDQDVKITEQIFLKQREIAKEKGLIPVIFSRCLLTPVLAEIEFNGMKLDSERVEETYNKYLQEAANYEEMLVERFGNINWNSGPQVAELLYDKLGFEEITWRGEPQRTDSGRRRTDTPTLLQLKPTTEEQEQFIKLYTSLNKVDSALSKSLQFFYGVCEEKGGVFHGSFNQTVTKTNRLSASGRPLVFNNFGKKAKSVQFQNMDRKFKRLFKARIPHWKIGEVDGANLEFRVAAYLGNDEQAIRDIRAREDVHSYTASIIGCDRQTAKSHTFKPLYGGESGTASEKRYYEAFRRKYPGVVAVQNKWIEEVSMTKKLVMETGFIFNWPESYVDKKGRLNVKTNVCNYPVQQFATGDIIPISLIYMFHRMRSENMESFIVNTIHDSVVSEIAPNEVDRWKKIATQSFTEDVYNYLDEVYNIKFHVPLGVGLKVGDNWGEGEEEKIDVEPSYNYSREYDRAACG